MNYDYLISIIVPIYNMENYLSKCLDSIVCQTHRNLQIICVNDGSTDNSLSILESYANNDSRITIINKKNSGISDSRNIALKSVNGDYLMYVDSDDWIEKNTCEIALNKAIEYEADVIIWNYISEFQNSSKNKKIFGPNELIFDNKNISILHRRFVGLYEKELSHPESADSIVTVWGKLYRSDMIENSNIVFVDTKVLGTSEDALFNIQVFEYVKKAVYIDNCLYHYRKTNSNSITKKYKPYLQHEWGMLHKQIKLYLDGKNCDDSFYTAYYNRISLSIIGLGMNIMRADNYVNKLKEIDSIIKSSEYRFAIKLLTLKYFPIHWKLFFWFVKHKCVIAVYLMLSIINRLKNK